MTEADYVWLTNDGIDPAPVIRVVAGSEWHYAQGGWHATDAVPELTAAEIEAADADEQPELEYDAEAAEEEPAAELAEDEQEPDPQPPAEEES